MDLNDLLDLEAIKRLKYRYMRCVDMKLWDEMGECFTSDATVSYDSGRWVREGRDAIVDLLRNGLGPEVVSSHTVHHPEIDLTGPSSARGRWALEDYVFNRANNSSLHGGAYYEDEYVKIGDTWCIQHTGYTRTFEHRTSVEPRWLGPSA